MRIAVLAFEANGVSKADALKISDIIRSDIINSGNYIVIERAQMGQILKEQAFQQTGCTNISCVVELGKILSAKKILVGSIMKLGNQIIITGRIVDVEKGVVEFSDKAIAESDSEIVMAVTSFVYKLSASINVAKSEKKEIIVEKQEPVMEKQKPVAKDKSKPYFPKNTYFISSLTFLSLTAASFGGGVYFNSRLTSNVNKYDDLADIYNSSTDPTQIFQTRNEMDKLKKDADKYELYRNISLGAGGVFSLVTGYFFYEYFTYESSESIADSSGAIIIPIFYTYLKTNNNANSEYSFASGLSYRF